MQPVLPLPVLLPLLALVLGVGAWWSWRGSASLPPPRRALLLTLRVLALAGVAGLLLNPGRWTKPDDTREKPWLVMVDRSASMQRELGESTRAETAIDLTRSASEIAAEHDVPVRLHAFGRQPGEALENPDDLPAADAEGSDLVGSLRTLVAGSDGFSGVLVLSDGRQTTASSSADLENLALRLRARRSPLHAVALGAEAPVRDLALSATRPTVTTFTGQTARIPFVVETSGLGPLKPEIVLRDAEGGELARQTLEIRDAEPAFAAFEIPAPESARRWTLETDVVPGEDRPGNNRAHANIRPLTSKTRVFLAEGAPYWDSKFLAQLLRRQVHMDVHSVHRLSEERFFRIDSGDEDGSETDAAIFPDSLDALARYDLVVFGKNIDAFLTPARLEALRAYVRDRGGAVLFARGRATSSDLPALESLQPVVWGRHTADDFRFAPSPDGAAAGLFGEVLPPPDASLWNALPTLRDGRQVEFVKPFARVLAEGVSDAGSGLTGSFPALVVRRYGQGVSGLVNGDGLWKWDFYPEARDLGNMYEDFWTQLIQWMASYSEFLPGQDFSLRLPGSRGPADETVALSMSFRGTGEAPDPAVRVEAPDGSVTELTPAARPGPGGHPGWRASFTPDQTGAWKVSVIDPRAEAPPTPEATYLVPAPPAESDDLRPDPAFLGDLAESTGGALHSAADLPDFLAETLRPTPPEKDSAGAVWEPAWAAWPVALGLAALLATEWYLRRRQGLA